MSDSIEMTGCLQHTKTGRYFVVYEDFQEISEEHPDQIAAFLRILEVKTNKKIVAYSDLMEEAVKRGRELPPLNLWIEIAYSEFVYWSLNTISRSSFQKADKEATQKMLVKSRVCSRPSRPDDPESPQVQYKEYLLVLENVQAAIDKKETPITGEAYEQYGSVPPVIENIPLLQKTRGMLQETRPPCSQKHTPPVTKNRYKDNNKENTKESMKDSGDASNVVEFPTTHTRTTTSVSTGEENQSDQVREGTKEIKPLLTPVEEAWFREVYCKGKWIAVAPKMTPKLAEHVVKISQVIKTVEEWDRYYDYVKARIANLSDSEVKPGNLAEERHLNGWKQTQLPSPSNGVPASSIVGVSGLPRLAPGPALKVVVPSPRKLHRPTAMRREVAQ